MTTLKTKELQKMVDQVLKFKVRETQYMSVPILSHGLVQVKDGEVSITATDLEAGARATMDTGGEGNGLAPVCVPLNKLKQFLGGCGETLDLTHEKKGEEVEVKITSDNLEIEFMGLPPDEFPPVKRIEGDSFILRRTEFLEGLSRVYYAISTDTTRPVLCGVLFETKGDRKWSLVAADGKRLAHFTIEEACGYKFQTIIPRSAVAHLIRVLGKNKGNDFLTMTIGKNQIAFEIDNILIVSRLIDGQFPNWRQVIPKREKMFAIEVNTKALLKGIDKVSSIGGVRYNSVALRLERGQLVLTCESPGEGICRVKLPIQWNGKVFTIGVNYNYLPDALRAIDSERVKIYFTDHLSPLDMEGVGEEGQHILMPVKL